MGSETYFRTPLIQLSAPRFRITAEELNDVVKMWKLGSTQGISHSVSLGQCFLHQANYIPMLTVLCLVLWLEG